MWYFKRKKGQQVKAVIHNDCYQKLPDELKNRFYPAPSDTEVTHTVQYEEDDELNPFFLAAVGEGLELMLGSAS
jgi:hypothetical protein